MGKIYFISDTHYGHTNICKGVSGWSDTSKCRDFSTVPEMNQAIVDAINSTVDKNDILYHLGDWSFGGIKNIWEFRKQIICENIHLILGNHDHHIQRNKTLPNCHFKVPTGVVMGPWNSFTYGKPQDGKEPKIPSDGNVQIGSGYRSYVEARDLFKSVSYYKEYKFGKGRGDFIVMSHYPMRIWNTSHHGSIMLHGHCHGTLPEYKISNYDGEDWITNKYRTMDVGVDTREDFKPYSLEEVLDIMSTRIPVTEEDHHNESTN